MKKVDPLMKERYAEMLASPPLSFWYKQRLLEVFPVKIEKIEYFHPNTFTGSDNTDYLNCFEIFGGKQWDEVNFENLYLKYTQFLMLNEAGKLYYLPAFLNNFYDLKYSNLEYFTYFLGNLEDGFYVPSPDEIHEMSKSRNYVRRKDYSTFESITPEQSKLVAVFLTNVANLFPSNWHAAQQAQAALTNYWGNFLLF